MAGKSRTTASPDVGNTIYNSPYRVLAWEWLRNGMPVTAVKEALDEKGLHVTLPVIYNFRDIMQDMEMKGGNTGGYFAGSSFDSDETTPTPMPSPEDVPESLRIKNDGEVLDLIILKFANQLKAGEAEITPAVALKAIDMKKNMMGAKYRGQTIWSLMESQLQIDKLLEVMNRHVTHEQFEAIVAEMENDGVISTQRPKALGSILNLDREIDKEAGGDPISDATKEADVIY